MYGQPLIQIMSTNTQSQKEREIGKEMNFWWEDQGLYEYIYQFNGWKMWRGLKESIAMIYKGKNHKVTVVNILVVNFTNHVFGNFGLSSCINLKHKRYTNVIALFMF